MNLQDSTISENKCCVYRHVRLDTNEVFYVGVGSDEKRAYSERGRNIFWKRTIQKCTTYRVDIILNDLSWDDARTKEIEFITLYGRRDLGKGTLVNLTDGGEGTLGFKPSEATKEKQIAALKKRVVSEDTRRKIGEASSKRKWSEEQKAKSKAICGDKHPMFGRKRPKEVVEKVRQSNLGKKRSEEIKERQRQTALRGKDSPYYKIPRTEEVKKRMREAWIKRKASPEYANQQKNLSKSLSVKNLQNN
jgi:hypothetical protein